jgi:diguanylate cyclase
MPDAYAQRTKTRGRFDAGTALAALRSIGDAVICTDEALRINFMNVVAEKLTAFPEAEAMGRAVGEVLSLYDEDSNSTAVNPADQCLRSASCYIRECGLLLLTRSGDAYDIGLSASPIRATDGAIRGCVILFNNVTEIRAQEKKLAHTALHDALTGLPNRASFITSLHMAIDEARNENRTHILCFIDLDRFKRVNDKAGHAAGDTVLAETAKIIAGACGSRDIAARLGGDEFALLLRDTSAFEATARAEAIVSAIRRFNFRWKEKAFRIGASIGATVLTCESPEISEILHQADKACYAAKESGRSRVCIYNQEHQPIFHRLPDPSGFERLKIH